MTPESSSGLRLLQQLDELRKDNRLARVFGSADAGSCVLHLWLLELKQNRSAELHLLYGCVIPATFRDPKKWYTSEGNRFPGLKDSGVVQYARPLRLSLYDSGGVIFSAVKELCRGIALKEVCDRLGMKLPDEPYGNFHLADSADTIASYYAVRPVVLLEIRDSVSRLVEHVRPAGSPLSRTPAFAGSLFLLNKGKLWGGERPQGLPEAELLTKTCLSHLAEETGLDFKGTDAGRLGNLEWLTFPAADEHENPKVIVVPQKDDKETPAQGVEVVILSGTLPIGTCILARCRHSNHEVTFDQCRTVAVADGPTTVRFDAAREPGHVLVSIWVGGSEQGPWEIWHEESFTPASEIVCDVGIIGLQGTIKTDWFKDFARSKAEPRAEKAQQVKQVRYERVVTGGHSTDPWFPVAKSTRESARRLFPEHSGGGFFPKGWGARGPGLLSFVEWFWTLTEATAGVKVVLIDPYFDRRGVELFARARATQVEYAVLTNTQVRLNSGPHNQRLARRGGLGKFLAWLSAVHCYLREYQLLNPRRPDRIFRQAPGKEPARAKGIRESCDKLEPILARLNLTILDLRSEGGGDTRLFHDRYVLVYNGDGRVKSGYHLSNSIQGATRKSPMLVTPIPSDLIGDVAKYVDDLLYVRQPTVNDAEVVPLYPTSSKEEPPARQKVPKGPDPIPNAPSFFSTLLDKAELASLSPPELKEFLLSKGLMTKEGGFTDSKRKQWCLGPLAKGLLSSGGQRFAALWTGFGEWLARTSGTDTYRAEMVRLGGRGLADKLREFLPTAPLSEFLHGPRSHDVRLSALSLLHMMRGSFTEALDSAGRLPDYPFWQSCRSYGVWYGALAMTQLDPHGLVAVATELVAGAPADDADPKSEEIALRLALIVGAIVGRLYPPPDDQVVRSLLECEAPFFRSLAATAVMKAELPHVSESRLQKSLSLLRRLPTVECIHALAEWLCHLDVRIGRRSPEESVDMKSLRQALLKQIVELWPDGLSREELRSVVLRLGGPIEGSRAVSITTDLLIPLEEKGSITIEDIAQLWLDLLLGHLQKKPRGFNSFGDKELTEICGWCLTNLDASLRQCWLEKLTKREKNALQILRRPFARSNPHTEWYSAFDAVLWLSALLGLLWLNGTDSEGMDPGELVQLREHCNRLSKVTTSFHFDEIEKEGYPLLVFALRAQRLVKDAN